MNPTKTTPSPTVEECDPTCGIPSPVTDYEARGLDQSDWKKGSARLKAFEQ